MTLSSETMMKLMAYADGELEGAERAEIEKLLAASSVARNESGKHQEYVQGYYPTRHQGSSKRVQPQKPNTCAQSHADHTKKERGRRDGYPVQPHTRNR